MYIPTPHEIKALYPVEEKQAQFVWQTRSLAQEIICGKSAQIACLLGPCSIHDPRSALEYAKKLLQLSQRLSCITLFMRLYFEKPRSHFGWKGLLYDPYLDQSNNLKEGIKLSRQLLHQITQLNVPCAMEFVDPLTAPYFQDLVSWAMIGARTSASQPHRQLASSFNYPIGFKNSIHGELSPAIYGILAANIAHAYLNINEEGVICAWQTKGNPFAHLVLRGSDHQSNYDPSSIIHAYELLKKHQITTQILVDCSHGNSYKDYKNQKKAFQSVIEQIQYPNSPIKALMLESHLFAGKQAIQIEELAYGISVTDSCLGWEETEGLILWADEVLSTSINSVQS